MRTFLKNKEKWIPIYHPIGFGWVLAPWLAKPQRGLVGTECSRPT